jgi:dihydroorotase
MAQKRIIIKQAKVVDPRSSLHGKTVDFLFEDENIKLLQPDEKIEDAEIFTAPDLHVSPGWFDVGPEFGDPGYEHKEDLDAGLNAALHGGYSSVAISPNSLPVVDNKTAVEYIMRYSEEHWLEIYSLASFSQGLQGEALSELFDMRASGAIGFSHANTAIKNISLLKLAMQYNRTLGTPLQLPAFEAYLSKGQMHEGEVSTLIGLKGIPALSECLALSRDIQLAEYAESAVHFNGISSKEGVALLKDAQAKGQAVTADTAITHLYFTDEDLKEYNSNFKTQPPIRAAADRDALLNALKEGTISFVRSQHSPQDVESKKCEFDHASFGAETLEASFGALRKATEQILDLDKLVELLAYGPRELLGLDIPHIEDGKRATLTFFNPHEEWTFTEEHIKSKSKNSPFIGKTLKGKAVGVLCNGILAWTEEA